MMMKRQRRVAPILNLLTWETIEEYFGTQDHEAIWQELNPDESRCSRAINWLDMLITTQVEGAIHEMNKKAQVLQIQEAHRPLKTATMRRFIDKKQSPQCQIDMAKVTEHFRETWSRPLEDVVEAEEDLVFIWSQELQKKTKKR
jgi:hypothetical protein